MLFTTDKQTLDDLGLLSRGGNSIYDVFNSCQTRGGAAMLEGMFHHPLSVIESINERIGIIRFFAGTAISFPFKSSQIDIIEPYLANRDERSRLTSASSHLKKQLTNLIAMNGDVEFIYKGIEAIAETIFQLKEFISSPSIAQCTEYSSDRTAIADLLKNNEIASVFSVRKRSNLSNTELVGLDSVFRFRDRDKIERLLQFVYKLDVYVSVARTAKQRGFCFPVAFPTEKRLLNLSGVYHMQVKNAVPTDIRLDEESNVVFLTGANMAGKSTFMKSLSISLFLAHMGFPVPASHMEFSVLDGIYTTINLPDNLGMGASHFYAEVLRVKKMGKELKESKSLFVLFDELFRGTNVKDAYEATIAITKAFAGKKNSFFVISTHIIEAGEVLMEECKNIQFIYLPTRMQGNTPVYTYKLEKGITEDRHGMIIINNEKILEILN